MGKFEFHEEGTEHLFIKEERRIIDKGVKGLKFDKRLHRYTMDGIELKSATQVISNVVRPFERAFISRLSAKKELKNGNKLLGDERRTRQLWDAKGERKSALGTSGHAFCEAYWLSGGTIKPVHRIEENAKKLMDNIMRGYTILDMEVNRGIREYMIGYTIDIEMRHKITGDIYLGDFKFTEAFTQEQYKQIKGRQANYLLDPFRAIKLREVAYDKGQIQLAMYKKFYEKDTGRKVKACLLFHIDNLGETEWYKGKGYNTYIVKEPNKEINILLKPHKSIRLTVYNKL